MRTAPARRRAAATIVLTVALTGLSAGPANAALHDPGRGARRRSPAERRKPRGRSRDPGART